MSILTFDELNTGTTFVIKQPARYITYKVIGRIGEDTLLLQSIDPVNNDMYLDQRRFNAMVKLGKHFFDSMESAKAFEIENAQQQLTQTIKNFANDKDAFIEYVLKHVYRDNSAESGDPDVAEIVRHVTAVHYPDVDLGR